MRKDGQAYTLHLHSSVIDKTDLLPSPEARAVLSSGTGLIGIPSREYQNLLTFYFDKTVFLSDCGRQKCTPCNRPLSSQLVLGLGSYKFALGFSKLWKQRQGTYCELLAHEAEGDNWILGANFLQDYLVEIDYDRERVTITGTGISDRLPSDKTDSDSHAGWIVGGVLVGVIVIGVIGFLCYRKHKREKRREAHIELSELEGERAGPGESKTQGGRDHSKQE